MKNSRFLRNSGILLIIITALLMAVQTFASPGPYVRREAVAPEEQRSVKTKAVSPYAWQKIDGVCYNGSGKKIPGAVTRGIDVSEWQGRIDWEKVKKSNVDFAFIRLAHGLYYEDKYFDYNMRNAINAGIPVGVYIYSTARTYRDALREAEYVLSRINGYKISYPVVFDMEDSALDHLTSLQRTNLARVFCDTIKKAGYYPAVYSNLYWYNYKLLPYLLREYDIWLASFGDTINRPDREKYRYTIWQSTGGSTTPGMNSTAGLIAGIPIHNNIDVDFGFVDYTKIITPRTRPVSSYRKTGILKSGWCKEEGKTYYYYNGFKLTGNWRIDGKTYSFSAVDGSMRVNKPILFPATGKYAFCGPDGSFVKNMWVSINGDKYYFGYDYMSYKGARMVGGKGYYFDKRTCVMKTNLKIVAANGQTYYFTETGVMAIDGWHRLTENGKKNTYYFGTNGMAYKGWHTIDGNDYFFYTDDYPIPGVRAENVTLAIGNRYYRFDENGVCVNTAPIK